MKVKLFALLMFVVGLVGYLFFSNAAQPPAVDPIVQAACEARYAKSQEVKAHCKEANFAAGVTATSAKDAAEKISAVNNAEVANNAFSMFFLGLMLVGAVFGLISVFKKKAA